MTIASVHFITFGQSEPGRYAITVDLTAADRHRFGLLTAKVVNSRPPHDQLAIILRGHVLNAPMVGSEIIDGHVHIDGFTSRALAEHIFRLLRTS
jgi:preprotein translocase subunit SecD